jgi:aspartate carbamoyltransferase regulatory subunit
MQLLDKLRKTTIMEKKDLECIEQYKKIYKSVIQEAKKWENDNCISSYKNKVKATWQLINKELGEIFHKQQEY